MKLYQCCGGTRFTLADDEAKTVFLLDNIYDGQAKCYLGNVTVHIPEDADIVEFKGLRADWRDY